MTLGFWRYILSQNSWYYPIRHRVKFTSALKYPLHTFCRPSMRSTVMILCIRTDKSGQTVDPDQSLLLKKISPVGLHYLPFHIHMSRIMTKPTIRPVWSESSLSAWRKLGFLATYWVHSENWSDWADAQADLSLCWVHSHFVLSWGGSKPVCRKSMDSVDSLDFYHGLNEQSGPCPWTLWTKSSESMDKVQWDQPYWTMSMDSVGIVHGQSSLSPWTDIVHGVQSDLVKKNEVKVASLEIYSHIFLSKNSGYLN